ncbi:DUF3027 domain-containing protein [Solicola gregarius]|uniref:DUF3027 domain-containing protein n=1 Tax=Solicola gregarius TaxID=2908642 RepID=A0AA46TJZ5_9ACTN|nr:DUF3027 domain-containing protein [Solicola gregarius]UYM06706.1 DUF3027 domain-containing protein [Solicola gregarius]
MAPTARTSRPDSVGANAVEAARAALLEAVGPADVGEHQGVRAEGERTVSHEFACTRRGYRGWRWSVTVTRAPRQRSVTVNEIVLLPGADAIIAPDWTPYRERVQPGDMSPGDLLPPEDDDPRLVPGWSAGDSAVDALVDPSSVRPVADEVGLGRLRVLSLEGRDLAAERWYEGPQGPDNELTRQAPHHCRTCGFLVSMSGPLGTLFGVCSNGLANDDGRVVSLDHGCGAHSKTKLSRASAPRKLPAPVLDTVGADDIELF